MLLDFACQSLYGPGEHARLARRLGSNRLIGEAPMNTAGAAVLPGTGVCAPNTP